MADCRARLKDWIESANLTNQERKAIEKVVSAFDDRS